MAGEEIKIPITAQITDVTVDAAANTKAAEAIGGGIAEASEKSSTAMKGVKLAAKELFHEFGVGGPLSRVLSSETMHLAEELGKGAAAFGVVGLAVGTAYGVYTHFVEKQKEADKASIALADSLFKEVQAFEGVTPMTKAETDATYDLYLAKRELATLEMEKGIEAKTRDIEKMQEQYDATKRLMYATDDFGEVMGSVITSGTEEEQKQALLNLKVGMGELEKMYASLDRLQNKKAMSRQEMFGPKKEEDKGDDSAYWAKQHTDAFTEYYQTRMAIQTAIREDNAKMMKESEEENLRYADMTRQRMEWDNQEAENKRRAMDGSLSMMASSFQIMYQSGFSHANATLNLYKLAASAEAMVSADRAAGAALAWGTELGGPALGIAMGSVVFLAGMARVKDIWSRKLGDTGGAGGSVPTYSVSSTTGETQGGGQSAPNVYISLDGGKTYNKQQLAYDMVNELWRNNGTIDGKTIAIERSM